MPPPFREILDSEDEDELLPEPTGCLPVATTCTAVSGEDAAMEMDADQSTASTGEQLRRAHADLMAPTQHVTSVVDAHGPVAVDSIPPVVNSHKRPLNDVEAAPLSSGKLKRIKPLKAPDQFHQPSTGSTVPGATIPESVVLPGTNDTVPGDTYPASCAQDVVNRTPKQRTRKSSQQQSSASEQQNSLTPWSASAIGSSDRINSDDAAVGLPKEMYQPRPSRSRSAQVDTSHYDYSLIPEKAFKKARRLKTDTQVPTSEPVFPANPILQPPEFERLTPTPDLGPGATAPEDTINVQAAAELVDPEPPPSTKSQALKKATKPKPRARQKKQPVMEEDDELALDNEIAVAPAQTPASTARNSKTEVQVVISPAKPKPDNDMMQNILAGLGHVTSVEPSPQPEINSKSRGRGRKQKAKLDDDEDEGVEPIVDENIKEDYEPEHDYEPEPEPEPSPQPELKSKSKIKAKPKPKGRKQKAKVEEEEAEVVEPIVGEVPKEESDPEPEPEPEPEIEPEMDTSVETPKPKKPDAAISAKSTAKKTTGSSTKPSWQQSTYRVGLSKTQRIPSLLKVFKK